MVDSMIENPCIDGGRLDLGCRIGDSYRLKPDAEEKIASITNKLRSEDKTLRSFRRSLAFSRLARHDLAPILYASGSVVASNKSESIKDIKQQLPIFTSIIRLFVDLTTPVECLFPVDDLICTKEGSQTITELEQHLSDIKDIFLDNSLTTTIIAYVEKTLTKVYR